MSLAVTEPWRKCPSTHCERGQECTSPIECIINRSWGDVFWKHIRAGCDRSDAAFRADEWEKRQSANTVSEDR